MDLTAYAEPKFLSGTWLRVMMSQHGMDPRRDYFTDRIRAIRVETIFNIGTGKDSPCPVAYMDELKPIILKPPILQRLFTDWGTTASEDLCGRWVEVYLHQQGRTQPSVRMRPGVAPQAPPDARDKRPIGENGWNAVRSRLAERGLKLDAFIEWARKSSDDDLISAVVGVEPAEYPRWALDRMKVWIDQTASKAST